MSGDTADLLGLGAVLGSGIVMILIVCGICFLIFVISNVLSLMLGAKIANIENRTFFKALIAAILIVVFGGLGIGFLGAIHPLLGLIGLFLVPGILIKLVYGCSIGKAIIAYILNLIAIVIAFCLILASIFLLGALGLLAGKNSTQTNAPTQTNTPTVERSSTK